MSADLDNQPYDNVEFPIRRINPGSGTWPGPARDTNTFKANVTSSQSKGYTLAPLVESREGTAEEEEEERMELFPVEDERRNASTVSSSQTNPFTVSRPGGNMPMAQPKDPKLNHVGQTSKTSTASTSTKSSASSTLPRTQSQSTRPPPSPSRGSKSSLVVDQPRLEDLTWNDFNPVSQDVFDTAYTRHKYFYKFTDAVLKQGNKLKSGVWDGTSKPGETMTYEQLLQGVLMDGEKLLLSGGGWLNFRTIEFYEPEETRHIKAPLGEGRICLTNLRMLLLCAETAADAKLFECSDPSVKGEGYKLEVSKLNNVFFQNIPLDCFESVELSSSVGTAADTKMTLKQPMCCGLFSCIGAGRCGYTWSSSPPLPMNISKRLIRLGVYMPPWRTPAIMRVHLHPKTSLTSARDFVVQIQNHVPQMQFQLKHVPTSL